MKGLQKTQNKESFIDSSAMRIFDGLALLGIGFTGGYSIVGLEWLRENVDFIGDWFTNSFLPQTLSSYTWDGLMWDALGLGFFPMLFAMGWSLYKKDKFKFDNFYQMLQGLAVGLIFSVGLFSALNIFDVSLTTVVKASVYGAFATIGMYIIGRKA